MEHIDVRLARIEEGLVSLHGKVQDRHDELIKTLAPMVDKVDRHQMSIALIKRDRKWIYGILAFVSTGLGIVAKTLTKI